MNHIAGLADFNGDYYSNLVSLTQRQFMTIDAICG